MSEDVIVATFRVFQELLTNVARHSSATKVDIILTNQDSVLTLVVLDNGKGITKSQISHKRSFGIMGINERIKALHGKVTFDGVKEKGTTVTVEIPLKKGEFI